jgi:hypothetical protein
MEAIDLEGAGGPGMPQLGQRLQPPEHGKFPLFVKHQGSVLTIDNEVEMQSGFIIVYKNLSLSSSSLPCSL